jgi:uncharacterized protein YdaU (DUF1376 family)
MIGKIRHVDLFAEEFMNGVSTVLTMPEMGVYSLICFMIYTANGPIADDADMIARKIKDATADAVRAIIDRLVTIGKLVRKRGKLLQKRCELELQRATKRVISNRENGPKGGRPRKQINSLQKPNGFENQNPPNNPNLPTKELTNLPTKERKKDSHARAALAEPESFALWYQTYPRRKGRASALRAYRGAIAKATPEILLVAARQFDNDMRDKEPKFIPFPATWLNAERWKDEPDLLGGIHGTQNRHNDLIAAFARAADGVEQPPDDC